MANQATQPQVEDVPQFELKPLAVLTDVSNYSAKTQHEKFAALKSTQSVITKAQNSELTGNAYWAGLYIDFMAFFPVSDFFGVEKQSGQIPIKAERAKEFAALCIDPKKAHIDGKPQGRGTSWGRKMHLTVQATGAVTISKGTGGVIDVAVDRKALKARMTDGNPIALHQGESKKNGELLGGVSVYINTVWPSTADIVTQQNKLKVKLEKYNTAVNAEIARLESELTK